MTQGEDMIQMILSEGLLPMQAASPTLAADVAICTNTSATHLLQHHKLRASLFDYQLKPAQTAS
jgi:hypothetical protein